MPGGTAVASLVVVDQLSDQSGLHQQGACLRGESQCLQQSDTVANSGRRTAVAGLLLRPLRALWQYTGGRRNRT